MEAYLEVGRKVSRCEVYSGPDHLVHWAMQNGAAGCISGLGNVMPDVLARIVSSFSAGDSEGAAAVQEIFLLRKFRKDLYALGYPPAMVRARALGDGPFGRRQPPACASAHPAQDTKRSGT